MFKPSAHMLNRLRSTEVNDIQRVNSDSMPDNGQLVRIVLRLMLEVQELKEQLKSPGEKSPENEAPKDSKKANADAGPKTQSK